WSHVVAVWTGSAALLYVNGTLADNSNLDGLDGGYVPNTAASVNAIFGVGALLNGATPYEGSVDEIAFYPTALMATQIAAHFEAAADPAPDAYSTLVKADGAIEYLQQNPPMVKLAVVSGQPTVTFTGILSKSIGLVG